MADKQVKLILTADGRQAEQTLGSLSNTLKGMGTIAGASFGAFGLAKFSADLLAVNTETQRLSASLRTVTGSGAGAQRAFDFLSKFAAETPYQITEVVSAFTKLKAMGLDPSEEALRSYGNTASAMGKDLNMMIEAVADAATGEFERLKEFGIKSKSEGDKVSFTFQGVTTTVGKNAAEIEGYLRGIGNVQFAGAMSEQMNTLGGATSNLRDNYENLLRTIGDAGANAAAKDSINALSDILKSFTDTLRDFGKVATDDEATQAMRNIFGRTTINGERQLSPEAQAVIAGADALLSLYQTDPGAENFIGPRVPSGGIRPSAAASSSSVRPTTMSSAQLESAGSMGDDMVAQWRIEQAKFSSDTIIGIEAERWNAINEITRNREQERVDIARAADEEMLANMQLAKDEWIAIEQEKRQQTMSTQSIVSNSLSILDSLGTIATNKKKQDFKKQQQIGRSLAIVRTAAGATLAYQEYGWPYGLIAAAAIIAAGAAQISTINSADSGGATTSVGAGPTSLQFNRGNVVTQPTGTPTTSGNLSVTILGNVIGEDKWVEESLVPALRRAGNRNVQLSFA